MNTKNTTRPEATVRIPGSKSISHRALITAALADGTSRLRNILISEDTLYTLAALERLGVKARLDLNTALIAGTNGHPAGSEKVTELFVGNSGTSLRLIASLAALGKGRYLLTGTNRMCERPIGELINALTTWGVKAKWVQRPGFPPIMIEGRGIAGGKALLSGSVSSQYLSSLLLAAPYSSKGVELEVKGELVSRPYVDLTIEVMKSFGVDVARSGYTHFKVQGQRSYRSRVFSVEGDVSSASYFWAGAAVTGRTITTENIRARTTRQGDAAVLDILEEMGCRIIAEDRRVTVQGGDLSGGEFDMSALPDMVPTVAAVGLFAAGKTAIRNVAHLRHKECDRLHVIAREMKRIGARVKELGDGLEIIGGKRLSAAIIDPENDHRIAMSMAVAALKVEGLTIGDPSCVKKSFPDFWSIWSGAFSSGSCSAA